MSVEQLTFNFWLSVWNLQLSLTTMKIKPWMLPRISTAVVIIISSTLIIFQCEWSTVYSLGLLAGDLQLSHFDQIICFDVCTKKGRQIHGENIAKFLLSLQIYTWNLDHLKGSLGLDTCATCNFLKSGCHWWMFHSQYDDAFTQTEKKQTTDFVECH